MHAWSDFCVKNAAAHDCYPSKVSAVSRSRVNVKGTYNISAYVHANAICIYIMYIVYKDDRKKNNNNKKN